MAAVAGPPTLLGQDIRDGSLLDPAERAGHVVHAYRGDVVRQVQSSATEAFDAGYYELNLTLDFDLELLTGMVGVQGTMREAASQLALDLSSFMTVSEVRDGEGSSLSFDHIEDVLTVDLGTTILPGGDVAIRIDYAGRPQASGFGSFEFGTLGDAGRPYAWTLSEPYGARDWWPSKDHPSDKADSVRISVSVPDGLQVASNGTLERENSIGGRTTFTWFEQYPISTYLVSLAVGEYTIFEDVYQRPDSLVADLGSASFPIVHYRYRREHGATVPSGWLEVTDAMAVFEWWFGPYPFSEEKYGHAEFTWGGGMEHQTISSMGGPWTFLMAHELAHQWFGDAVTLQTWPHLWLNEGFASYAEFLYWEAIPEYQDFFRRDLAADQALARLATGTLVVEDTTSINNLFASSRVYTKGSSVVHMLRYVLGDNVFREVLRAYMAEDGFRYGTATTNDFQQIAETVSGRQLDWFFRQWVTEGTGYPIYNIDYEFEEDASGYSAYVTVRQLQDEPDSNWPVFEMPITIAIATSDGEVRFTEWNDQREQTFEFDLDTEPITVTLDPDGDILRNESVSVDSEKIDLDGPRASLLIYPNPADEVVRAELELAEAGDAALSVYDLSGRLVIRNAPALLSAGTHTIPIDVSGLAAGTYLLRVEVEGIRLSQKVTVVAH